MKFSSCNTLIYESLEARRLKEQSEKVKEKSK